MSCHVLLCVCMFFVVRFWSCIPDCLFCYCPFLVGYFYLCLSISACHILVVYFCLCVCFCLSMSDCVCSISVSKYCRIIFQILSTSVYLAIFIVCLIAWFSLESSTSKQQGGQSDLRRVLHICSCGCGFGPPSFALVRGVGGGGRSVSHPSTFFSQLAIAAAALF